MGSPATVPMFAPDGTLGDIPAERVRDAAAHGFKVGVTMKSADGQIGVVPQDRVRDAMQQSGMQVVMMQGGKDTGIGDMAASAAKSLGSDLWNIAKSAPGAILKSATPVGGLYDATVNYGQREQQMTQHAQQQKAAGYSTPYRILSPAAENLGVNVSGMEQSAQQGDVGGVMGHAAAVPAAMAATAGIAKAAPIISDAAAAAAERASQAAEKVRDITPKQAAQTVGAVGGAVTGHGPWSIPSATGGAYTLGRVAEFVLGKDRANTPIFARAPEMSLDNMTDALAQTIAQDRARFTEMQAKGLGQIPQTGAQPAAKTGEALATQPTSIGPEPPQGGKSAAPRFTAQDRAAAQSLLQDALKQSTSDVVDKAVSPQSQAANAATKSRIDVYLKQGDVAGAEKVLDNASRLTKSNWTPPERQPAPSVNEIRERVQDEAKASTQADQLDDHAIQQQMAYDLQRHGWSAEQEARREFIARNSTGFVKTQNREFGGPSLLSDQLPGEATPKTGKGGKVGAAPSASDDLTDILQQSLDDVRRKQKGK